MHVPPPWLLPACCLAALLWTGCQSPVAKARLPEPEARALAVQLANSQSLSQYQVAPFQGDCGDLTFEHGRWHWRARETAGQTEVEARVSFLADGSQASVQVQMFAPPIHELMKETPASAPPRLRLPGPEPRMLPERKER